MKGDVRNIYRDILSDDLVGLTENVVEMMYDFFNLKLEGKNKSKSSRNYLSIMAETNIDFDSDDDYSDDNL